MIKIEACGPNVKCIAANGQVGVFASEARARYWAAEVASGNYEVIPKEME